MSPAWCLLLPLLAAVRGIGGMSRISLQEAVNKTLCPYVYTPDIMEGRIPRVINRVECLGKESPSKNIVYVSPNNMNSSCTCQEIYTDLEVRWVAGHTEIVHYVVGCACINIYSQPMYAINSNIVN